MWHQFFRYREPKLKVKQELVLRFRRLEKIEHDSKANKRSGHFAGNFLDSSGTGGGASLVVLCKLCNKDGHGKSNGPKKWVWS